MKYLTDQDIQKFFEEDDKNDQFEIFECKKCGKKVSLKAPGTKNRNHCPFCLYSLHVDINVGDRKSDCGGLMKPIGKFFRPNNEEVIIHECEKCGSTSNNRVAGDDSYEKISKLQILQR
jgi:hypothetical protein